MELLKLGSRGESVKRLQGLLSLPKDGIFGSNTRKRVIQYQLSNDLKPDGIVGKVTMQLLMLRPYDFEAIDEDTDVQGQYFTTHFNQTIHKYYLPKNEYIKGPIKNQYVFLHHTAGWHNPYKVIDSWGRDNRGRVATEFVLGGQSIKGTDNNYDGVMVQAFPTGGQGWHLGRTGSGLMNRQSVGLEICNFGYLTDDYKTYTGATADKSQICKLKEPFKGYLNWHNYSDKQIKETETWLKFIAERDNIDIRVGLVQWIKKYGPIKAFDFQEDAYRGEVRGLLTHGNVRRDKTDIYPHPKLVEMLLKL